MYPNQRLSDQEVLFIFRKELSDPSSVPSTTVLRKLYCIKNQAADEYTTAMLRKIKDDFLNNLTPESAATGLNSTDQSFMEEIQMYLEIDGNKYFPNTHTSFDDEELLNQDEKEALINAVKSK